MGCALSEMGGIGTIFPDYFLKNLFLFKGRVQAELEKGEKGHKEGEETKNKMVTNDIDR